MNHGELAIDMGFEGSIMNTGISARVGSVYNNAFARANLKVFTINGDFNGGIFTGEDDKYGVGFNVGGGVKVAEGDFDYGFALLGMKVNGSIGGTAVSAHIGASNSYFRRRG